MKFLMKVASFVAPDTSSAARKYEPRGSDAKQLMISRWVTFVQPSEMIVTPVNSASPSTLRRTVRSRSSSTRGKIL
eukprot:scaffold163679_cov22-Tisochrysis_lutea.AAC.1